MSDFALMSLDISNFRSIRGHVHAPLDAKVVLVHGDNGAGKTSLLSAIELALTGKVQSLERADPRYEKQLLHRSATEGSVSLKALAETSEQNFKAVLNAVGSQSITALHENRAAFFRERVFLPQALLGQLLQIYQDAGSAIPSF
jgi:exonuclease SbcC